MHEIYTLGLLEKVEVLPWQTDYNFFDAFYLTARKILNETPPKSAELVSFFSYMPQYHQMTNSQFNYYLWWRGELEKKIFHPIEYCYILLHIYEILNLGSVISPIHGINRLADIWVEYRRPHNRLDKYMAEWLIDYCLIHKIGLTSDIPFPTARLEPIMSEIISTTTLPEFFLSVMGSNVNDYHTTYATGIAKQHYLSSKFYTENTSDLFEKHLPAALEHLYKAVNEQRNNSTQESITVIRDSYVGSVCAARAKRKIHVTYQPVSFHKNDEAILRAAARLAENYVRSALGARSRLSITNLEPTYQNTIAEYFAAALPEAYLSPEVQNTLIEKKYDAPDSGFDPIAAVAIEQESRKTAALLAPTEEEAAPTALPESQNSDDTIRAALCDIIVDDMQSFAARAAELLIMPTTLAEMINDIMLDIVGDIVLLIDEQENITFIHEYHAEVTKWLNN